MMQSENYKILYLIRFLPFIFILLCASIMYFFVSHETFKHFNDDIKFIKESYIIEEKKRVESTISRVEKYLINLEKNSEQLLKANLQESVYSAYNVIENIYEQNKETKTKEEITVLVKTALQNVRFNDGRGYYFINDMNGKNIFHPIKPETENKLQIDNTDAKGRPFQRNRIELLKKKDEIFFQYSFNKPNDKTREYEKLSFLKRFKPMNWFVGTGEYLVDFEGSLQKEALNFINKLELKDNGYIFVIKDKTIIADKHKELIGVDISKKANLKRLFEQYIKAKFLDEGVFSHYELKTNDKKNDIKNKISFLKHFKKWDWVIGTGFNLDNLENLIIKQQEKIEKEYSEHSKKLLFIGVIVVLILLFISYTLSKYMENILLKYHKKLEKKNAELVKAQDVAKIANWEMDIGTNELKYSKKTKNLLGLSLETNGFGNHFLKKILCEDDWDCFDKSINDLKVNKKNINCLFKVEHSDGTSHWIDCKGEFDEKNNKIIGTLQDITQLKKVEEEKIEKEKMLYQQTKMAAMGEMLANITHQWKQPLSTISTALTGMKLQKEYGTLNDADFMKAMDGINNATQYLSSTIDDFRNFFKPQQKKIKKLNIKDVIDKAVKLVQARFDSAGIKIVKELEDLEINSMENELIQVLLNFLSNSRDALSDLDELKKFVFIRAFKEENQLVIEVFDNAKGIKEKNLPFIFDPYFTTKDEDSGTGIGLYMSNEIVVKLLKTKIEVENYNFEYEGNKYLGAKFTIRLKI